MGPIGFYGRRMNTEIREDVLQGELLQEELPVLQGQLHIPCTFISGTDVISPDRLTGNACSAIFFFSLFICSSLLHTRLFSCFHICHVFDDFYFIEHWHSSSF
jgi:hypothetical protein